jgi:hypothetical protein
MTITEFLLARLDEYEAALDDATSGPPFSPVATHGGTAVHAVLGRTDPGEFDREVAWLRRDLEAKRRILSHWPDPMGAWSAAEAAAARTLKEHTLRALASTYSDHSDYWEGMEL